MVNLNYKQIILSVVIIMVVGLVIGYNLKKSATRDYLVVRDTLERFYYTHHETLKVFENQKTLIKNNYEKESNYFHSVPDSLVLSYLFNRSRELLSDSSNTVDSNRNAEPKRNADTKRYDAPSDAPNDPPGHAPDNR